MLRCAGLVWANAVWIGPTLLLTACGAGEEPARNDAADPDVAGIELPVASGLEDGADLASTLLEGIAAMVTGTSECVQLAAAARRDGTPVSPVTVPNPPRIAIEEGLRVTEAMNRDGRDYEGWVDVTATDEEGFNVRIHLPQISRDGAVRGWSTKDRRVFWKDLDAARCFAINYTGDPNLGGPGLTWLSLSRALLAELRRGDEVRFGMANEGDPPTVRYGTTYVGSLRRVGSGTFALILDDSLVQVPSVTARAEVRHADAVKRVEFEFLDDLGLPLMLRQCCERSADHVVRIERRGRRRIERALAETGKAIIYGIQFDFASAIPREDSAPVFEEIAEALRAHPDWHLRVEGHTDAIGDASSNLELSRQRAAAVKAELVRLLGASVADRLETDGYGESRPRGDNETLEGRAANRRVELVRSR